MKTIYIAETRLNNKSAYTHQVIKMCDAFIRNNSKLILLLPFEKKISYKKLKSDFLLRGKEKFEIKSLLRNKIINFFGRLNFGIKTANYIKQNHSPDIVITRSLISSVFLSIYKINHFIEIHSELKSITKFILINLNFINSRYIKKIIFISKALEKKFNVSKKRTLILHDGVDIDNFSKSKLVTKIKSVSYVGSFHEGKGVELVLRLAEKFNNLDFHIYGDPLKKQYNKSNNVKIHGYVNYKKVPTILSKSDVLLLPSAPIQYGRSKSVNISNYNSPLKMFDYLAAGKIIISSKLDGICEVLKNQENAILVQKYNLKLWEKALNDLIKKKYKMIKLQKKSKETAKKFTWNKRVKKIILNA